MNTPKKLWWSSSSGRIEFQLTLEQAEKGYHSGACDSDIAELMQEYHLASALSRLDPAHVIVELQETGGWSFDELQDPQVNLERLLWLACGDLVDQQFDAEVTA